MLSRIRNLLFGKPQTEQAQIEGMLRQLNQDVGQELPVEQLRPVLIPSTILAGGNWFGPFHHFPDLPVSLTWAYLTSETTMQYLSNDVADKLTAEGKDWRAVARKALWDDSANRPWTAKTAPDNPKVAVAAILQDGLAASRLLCYDQLMLMFPNGFRFFVPQRWTAFLISKDAPPDIEAEIKQFVQEAYDSADVPMSLKPHDHLLLKEALIAAGEFPS